MEIRAFCSCFSSIFSLQLDVRQSWSAQLSPAAAQGTHHALVMSVCRGAHQRRLCAQTRASGQKSLFSLGLLQWRHKYICQLLTDPPHLNNGPCWWLHKVGDYCSLTFFSSPFLNCTIVFFNLSFSKWIFFFFWHKGTVNTATCKNRAPCENTDMPFNPYVRHDMFSRKGCYSACADVDDSESSINHFILLKL